MDDRRLLTINTGSSSLKAGLYPLAGGEAPDLRAESERIGHDRSRLRLKCPVRRRLFSPPGGRPCVCPP